MKREPKPDEGASATYCDETGDDRDRRRKKEPTMRPRSRSDENPNGGSDGANEMEAPTRPRHRPDGVPWRLMLAYEGLWRCMYHDPHRFP